MAATNVQAGAAWAPSYAAQAQFGLKDYGGGGSNGGGGGEDPNEEDAERIRRMLAYMSEHETAEA